MRDVKAGWQRVRLGDVVTVVADYYDRKSVESERYVAGEHIDEGELRIRRWGFTTDDLFPPTFNRRFRAGDVLFHSRNLKKLAVPDFDGITGEKLFVLRVKNPAELAQEFLPFLLLTQRFDTFVNMMWAGSTNKFLNRSALVQYEFTLPPLEEQERLSKLLISIAPQEEAIRDALRTSQAISRRLLEGFCLDAMPLVEVEGLLLEPPKNGVSPSVNASQAGYPTLSVGSVYSGIVNTKTDLKYAELDRSLFERFQLRRDDVLVVRGNGNRELVGRSGIVEEELSDCFFPDLLIRLRFDSRRIIPAFANLLWNCVPVHASLVRRSKSTNGIYKVNGQDIRKHRIPLPSHETQLKMLDASATLDEARDALRTQLDYTRRLKSTVLGEIE